MKTRVRSGSCRSDPCRKLDWAPAFRGHAGIDCGTVRAGANIAPAIDPARGNLEACPLQQDRITFHPIAHAASVIVESQQSKGDQ